MAVELHLSFVPPEIKITVNGAVALLPNPSQMLMMPTAPAGLVMSVGIPYADAPSRGWRVNIDNLRLDAR